MYLRIAHEGYIYILICFIIGIIALFANRYAGIAVLSVAVFVAFFFRDPVRIAPARPGVIVSPADGRVVEVSDAYEGVFLKRQVKKVGIFLSLFDVHMNYAPIAGGVALKEYHKGAFKLAFVDKASELNENNAIGIKNNDTGVYVKQIAGLIARRIVCYPSVGDSVAQGERFGLIKFGSRVDVYFDPAYAPAIKVGDRVTGGETVLGERRVQ
ncbi:MAG TPA: phosphatidylserine decarboxylase family protein [bacterium]|nr:phosphatidylserine decarboxylase family protein [bacterium]